MKGASKVLCIISGIIDVFLTLGTAIFIIIFLAGGFSNVMGQGGGGAAGRGMDIMFIGAILAGVGALLALIAAICAFSGAHGNRACCAITIFFGFMGQNIFAIIGGILGTIAYKNE